MRSAVYSKLGAHRVNWGARTLLCAYEKSAKRCNAGFYHQMELIMHVVRGGRYHAEVDNVTLMSLHFLLVVITQKSHVESGYLRRKLSHF